MKKFFPFALLAVFSVFISCSENERPVNPLVGVWENREYVDSLSVWFVETLHFKNDSVFEQSLTVRQSEKGENLGYRWFSEGVYTQEANEISFNFFLEYKFHQKDGSEIIFEPKNKLGQVLIERIYSAFRVDLQSDFKEMDYQIICITPFDKFPVCEEVKRFIKVN